jgi:hypothetical protein
MSALPAKATFIAMSCPFSAASKRDEFNSRIQKQKAPPAGANYTLPSRTTTKTPMRPATGQGFSRFVAKMGETGVNIWEIRDLLYF